MAVTERRTSVRTGRGILEPLDNPIHPAGVQQAFVGMRIAFTALPIIAGLDKFFHILTNWDQYLAPIVATHLPFGWTTHGFMYAVGVIEIVAGLVVAFVPRFGGYLVCLWLCGIVANLLLGAGYYDIAARDTALALGAFSLARLANGIHRRNTEVPEVFRRTT